MKSKILKVMGVVLTLALVLSLFPVTLSAQPTPTTPSAWVNVPIPGALGNVVVGADCNLIAVANNGTTIYVADNQGANLFRSSNSGATWTAIATAATFTFPLIALEVAPDNPNIVGVVDSAAAPRTVFMTSDGGAIWAAMPAVAPVTAGTSVQDLDISPALPWGREYAVCTANLADGVAAGDIVVYGTGASPLGWANQTAPAADYTSVAFTPGYAGYRVILAVGSDITATANDAGTAGDSWLHIRNTSSAVGTWDAAGGFANWPVAVEDAAGDSPGETNAGLSSGMAIPEDFDPSTGTARRVYVYWNNSGVLPLNEDVYRVDDFAVRRLNVIAGATHRISSIAYSGTRSAGTLYIGDTVGTQVRWSADPFSALPTWTPSNKPPTGPVAPLLGRTQVALAADFDTSNKVYAGTSGAAANDQSGFHVSNNGGQSFNGLSLLDTAITALRDVVPSPDGDVLFLATTDGTNAGPESLWRSKSSPLGSGWERVATLITGNGAANNPVIVRVDPDYATTGAVYFLELGAPNAIRYSSDGGELFASRSALGVVIDMVVESKDVVYVAIGTTVQRSTASGWSWDLPQATNLGAIQMITLAPNGDVLVAGNGQVSYSTDGGSTFNLITPVIGGGGVTHVVADKDYATNTIIYASEIAGGIVRWKVGSYTAWEPIRAAATFGGTIRGLATREDVLYAIWDTAGAGPSGLERSLSPDVDGTIVAGTFFNTINAGLVAAAQLNRIPKALKVAGAGSASTLFAIDTAAAVAAGLYTLNDDMALLAPEFSHPVEVLSDPVGGRNDAYVVTWSPISNATTYDYRVYADENGTMQVYAQNLVVPGNPAAPAIVVPPGNLVVGRSYYARFRVRNQNTAAANWTNWSEMTKFDVIGGEAVQVQYLGPQPLGPVVGATNVQVSGTAVTWAPYARATKYEVKLATDAGLTDVLGTAQVEGTAYQYDGTLEYSTTYFWSARAIEPVPSDWGPTAHFTTMAEPAPPADDEPPVIIEQPQITPAYIYAIIAVGALLVIAVLVLIVRTRRPM